MSLDQTLREALQHHRAGRTDLARDCYEKILLDDPANSDALRLLGMIALSDGNPQRALDLIRRSIEIDPTRAESRHNLGDVLHKIGNLSDSAAAYGEAVRLRTDWPEAHGALGNVLIELGDFQRGIDEIRQVVRLRPDLAAGFFSLGRAYHLSGKRGLAIAAYSTAVSLKPDWPDAHDGLGNALWDEGRVDEAIAAYQRAVHLDPGHITANWSLGKIFTQQKKNEEAIEYFRQSVRFHPNNAKAHYFLGHALQLSNQLTEAAEEYRHATRLRPDTPEWQFKLAALTGDGSARTAPPEYLRSLFDEYAGKFDKHLVEKLNYRAPQQLLESVRAITSRSGMDILDLGCGTGLCGQQFRPLARRLVGVDLSPAMIHLARRRGIYDELITANLMETLAGSADSFDLILAGDVLIYIGDLSAFMPAVARALKVGGLFACSIEDYQGTGFFLHGEQRFAHSQGYCRGTAAASGLHEVGGTKVVIRSNAGSEVPGWIMIFQKL